MWDRRRRRATKLERGHEIAVCSPSRVAIGTQGSTKRRSIIGKASGPPLGRGSGACSAPGVAQGRQQPQGVPAIDTVIHQKASDEGAHLALLFSARKTLERGLSPLLPIRPHVGTDCAALGAHGAWPERRHRHVISVADPQTIR
jgi:hypothetical protein